MLRTKKYELYLIGNVNCIRKVGVEIDYVPLNFNEILIILKAAVQIGLPILSVLASLDDLLSLTFDRIYDSGCYDKAKKYHDKARCHNIDYEEIRLLFMSDSSQSTKSFWLTLFLVLPVFLQRSS